VNVDCFFSVSIFIKISLMSTTSQITPLITDIREKLCGSLSVSSLYELCAHTIVANTSMYGIDRLPLPESLKHNLKSYSMSGGSASSRRQAAAVPFGSGTGGGVVSRSGSLYKSLRQHRRSLGCRSSTRRTSPAENRNNVTTSTSSGDLTSASKKSCVVS